MITASDYIWASVKFIFFVCVTSYFCGEDILKNKYVLWILLAVAFFQFSIKFIKEMAEDYKKILKEVEKHRRAEKERIEYNKWVQEEKKKKMIERENGR